MLICDPLFWDKVTISNTGCWLWTAACDSSGYGFLFRSISLKPPERFTVGAIYPHRSLYKEMIGPVPIGLELDHLCRNTKCINPTHLEPVTHLENVRRGNGWGGINSRKTTAPCGHLYDKAELPNGTGRRCSTCRAIQMKENKLKRNAFISSGV